MTALETVEIDAVELDLQPGLPGLAAAPAAELPREVRQHLVQGTSALAAGVMIERGTGFLANILAARLGGAPVFGAYSLSIVTANNISTYAAGGIGATATRFSGKYPYGSAAYRSLAAVLAMVAAVSAGVAVLALWLGAAPIAHLLGKPALAGLLRWAAVPAAGTIVLECARGFFVGQRRIWALLALSVAVGLGMLLLLPVLAHQHNPVHMVIAQGCVAMGAVLLCLLLAKFLQLRAPAAVGAAPAFGSLLREVWGFGFVQLAGLVGSNLAGWWLTTLIARADTSLVQMSFFAVASQLRNLTGIVPGLLTEGSYATMATPEASSRTPHHVMALCSYASLCVSLLLACVGIAVVPWALHLVYGPAYGAASATVALALAIAVVHMGNAPAAARLTIVSIRATGVINTVWAGFVAVAATVLLLHGGSAWKGMAVFLAAHVLSSALVLAVLARRDNLPSGMVAVYCTGAATGTAMAALAVLREYVPAQAGLCTGLMIVLAAAAAAFLYRSGMRYGWLPSAELLRRALARVAGLFGRGSAVAGGAHV